MTAAVPRTDPDPGMVSITVPVYNERESLPHLMAALHSVLERIGRPWEVILVNDGSSDGSDRILDEMAQRDPHVKVVHFRRNAGQTAAMMAGIDFASGDVIVPIDA